MKKVLQYIIASLFALFTLSSCVFDDGKGAEEDGATITLSLSLPNPVGTRSLSPEPGQESQISTVDVLAFIHKNGNWVYDYTPAIVNKTVNGNDMTITATVRAMSQQQIFGIYVNASSKVSEAAPIRSETMIAVENRIVCTANTAGTAGEWPANNNDSGVFTPIPMYARTTAQVVDESNNPIGTYPLIRMLARIDVTLKSTVNNFKLEEACLFNYRTAGYLSYANCNFSGTAVSQAAVPSGGDHTGDPVKRPTVHYLADKSTDSRGEIKYSIYTFESQKITSEAGKTKGLALVVGGYYSPDGGATWSDDLGYYRIDLKTTDDASANISSDLLRNHSYAVEIQSVSGPGANEDIDAYMGESMLTAVVAPWDNGGQNVIGDKQYTLTVSEDDFVLNAPVTNVTVSANTDYNRTDEGFSTGIQFSQTEVTYEPSGGNWLTLGGATGSLTSTVSISASENTGTTIRKAKVYIKAGNITKTINITQLPSVAGAGSMISAAQSYVGAFWRASQTGERLIRIPAPAGAWSVWVYDYGEDFSKGDIVFDTAYSADPNVGWMSGANESLVADMNSHANDIAYQVNGNATYLQQAAIVDGYIFFRIGMKSVWTPTANKPVRYATIIVGYENNTKFQKIFLRQGEEADYLTHRDDVTDAAQKNYVRRYSTYNLATVTMSDAVDYVQIYRYGTKSGGTNASTFTEYPSQAGAMFQWAGAAGYQRFAWHPTKAYTGWSGNISDNSPTWDAATHETCPANYRRPNTAPQQNISEIASSLLYNNLPNSLIANNSVYGYYADGFFDRRTISAASVESSSYRTAYVGMLFYNNTTISPRRNASVFFPFAGFRNTSGAFGNAGTMGAYWSSLPNSTTTSYALAISSSSYTNFCANDQRSLALSVRCVVDE